MLTVRNAFTRTGKNLIITEVGEDNANKSRVETLL